MVSNPATSWYFDSISINFIFTDTIMPLLYFLFFLISIFNSFYVLNDTLSYLVFFDLILNLKITLAVSLNLIYYFYLDLYLYLSTKFYYILLVIFKTQRLTLLSNIWNYPELLLITYVFLNHLQICFTFYTTFEFAIYSTYMDNLVLLNFELFNYFFLYLAFTLLILLNVNQFILIKWYKNLNPLFNRIYYFFFSFAVEFRLQFNTTLQLVFFFFFLLKRNVNIIR